MAVINNREAKHILELIHSQWGCDVSAWLKEYSFNLSEKKKLYVVNRAINRVDVSKLYISSAGLYVANIKDTDVRLTIEGAQWIGPHATKNMIDISPEDRDAWIRGVDIETDATGTGFQIVRCGKDFMGCGRIKEGGILLNFLPKIRRISSTD